MNHSPHERQLNGHVWRRAAHLAVALLTGAVCALGAAHAAPSPYLLGFDGEAAHAYVSAADFPDGEFTLELSFRGRPAGDWMALVSGGALGDGGVILALGGEGSAYVIAGASVSPESLPWRANTWHHLACVYDGTDLRVYFDGELAVEREDAGVEGVNFGGEDGNFYLGGLGAEDGHFDGVLANVRIWDTARSGEEIREHSHAALSGDEPGLVGYWPLKDGEGETAVNLAADDNPLTLAGAEWREERFLTNLERLTALEGRDATLGPVELWDPARSFTYTWYLDGQEIPGAIDTEENALTLSAISESDVGVYHVVATDAETGDSYESAAVELELGVADWPMWRYDAARTSRTPVVFDEELHLQWVRELPEPKRAWRHQWDDRGKLDFDVSYSPVVMGDRIFVPSNVTDSVSAYNINDGAEEWRFYTDGPVRLAPVAWDGKVYFISDDGHLYCVEADTGELSWKFRGGPSDHRLLGNERIINMWAARGGPVIKDDILYFAAGIWPMHGVFIYAIDTHTGEIVWLNDTTSSDYVSLPHGGAYGYGSIAPQGYIAAGEDHLVVAGGRTPPATLDRHTGEVTDIELRGPKGTGNYAISAETEGPMINHTLEDLAAGLADELDGKVFNKLAAHGRFFVTTENGTLYCFGPDNTEPIRHEFEPASLRPESADWAHAAQDLLDELGESEGYALMLGAGSGDLLRELLVRSDLHIVVAENDSDKVLALRDELSGAGLYGRRAAVIEANPATFSVQPYLFSMVVSEDAEAAGIEGGAQAMADILDRLRPYGGLGYFGASEDGVENLITAAIDADVDQVFVENRGDHLFAIRGGPLTGAGQWTHQHQDTTNNLVSQEERVRLPLGLLWFGGPNNHNILPRHSGGPRPQIVNGRQFYLGVENVAARCVYTGRQLWDQPFPGIGHPFTNLELEALWEDGEEVYMTNIPGATYIGSPIVSLPDSVYVRYEGRIYRLDPATGETMRRFSLPGRSVAEIYGDADAPDWGHISVSGDALITTAEPHIFEDQEIGWTESYTGTSSRRIVVMDRFGGGVRWQREADIGFRHNAIITANDTLYLIDGLSEIALDHLARRGRVPEETSRILALDLKTGDVKWETDSNVYGTYLMYSAAHDTLIEGGSQDLRRTLEDEPRAITARKASDGEILWESGGNFTLPGAVIGDMLIPGRPGTARSILTGEEWRREQPHTGESSSWDYSRTYGCNTVSANPYMMFFRSGSAGFFDLEYDSGTGNFGGFRSGCTANLIAADGVLNALDYTRTCTCSYQHQTSLAMIHMPGDPNIEAWTRHDASPPNPERHGVNFGAPGRRVDIASGTVWYNEDGTHGRHPSAIADNGGGFEWVASTGKEFNSEEEPGFTIYDLIETNYTVRLHFAELEDGVQPGERVFDVYIDGERVLSGIDIVAKTGGPWRGAVEEVSVDAGMTMNIELRKSDGASRDPLLSGVELIANGAEQLASADE